MAEDDVKLEFVEDLWVQCDAASCRKWRRLPGGTVVDGHTRWYCRMNPDTRYNACDVDEEFYDERNEILLASAPVKETTKTRNRGKKRNLEKGSDGASALKRELQKRRQWCEKKNRALSEGVVEWTLEDGRYLHVHAPEAAARIVAALDLVSALSYFAKEGHVARQELLQNARAAAKTQMIRGLRTAMADLDAMLDETTRLV